MGCAFVRPRPAHEPSLWQYTRANGGFDWARYYTDRDNWEWWERFDRRDEVTRFVSITLFGMALITYVLATLPMLSGFGPFGV